MLTLYKKSKLFSCEYLSQMHTQIYMIYRWHLQIESSAFDKMFTFILYCQMAIYHSWIVFKICFPVTGMSSISLKRSVLTKALNINCFATYRTCLKMRFHQILIDVLIFKRNHCINIDIGIFEIRKYLTEKLKTQI